jgi:hypothetical protein
VFAVAALIICHQPCDCQRAAFSLVEIDDLAIGMSLE